jgi:hypothetical protein
LSPRRPVVASRGLMDYLLIDEKAATQTALNETDGTSLGLRRDGKRPARRKR